MSHMKRENEFDEGLEDTTEEAMSKSHKIQTPFISKLPPLEMPNINPSVFNPRGSPLVSAVITTQAASNIPAVVESSIALSNTYFNKHMKMVHGKEKRFACKECP